MKPLPPSSDQESTPDADQVQEQPPPSRRNLLRSVLVGIPVAIGLVPALASLGGSRAAYAEPGHPHCANVYYVIVGQWTDPQTCIHYTVYEARCWDCGGECYTFIVQG